MINVTKPTIPPIEKYIEYLEGIWANRMMTNDGELVKLLEKRLIEHLRVKNLALVTNGTLALQLALKSLKLKGNVITTPFTFAATTNVLLWENLTPVFADIDPETFNIDPQDVEEKIDEDTSAILAVHVYGNPCYVRELQEISDENNISLIYDAAHAFGVEYMDQSVLNYGDVSTLSFHATKVFNTIEGGALVVKDEELFEKLTLLRNHGIRSEEEVTLPGINAKMNEFQAAMGLCNLEDINENIMLRKGIYEYYKHQLADMPIRFQKIEASKYNFSYMPVCFNNPRQRNKIYLKLLENGIKSRKYFYPLTSKFDYFESINSIEKYNLKHAPKISNNILCLPIYPDLKLEEVGRIIHIIKETIKKAEFSSGPEIHRSVPNGDYLNTIA